ncbi:MAG: hypothetical protein PUI42_11420 [Lachnospiraceae bacterium]|nr:hypothetical protein [Lachnospiraceae bacterium]MDY3729250.1 hypothetical protein [Candidatus Choladocola sp.]
MAIITGSYGGVGTCFADIQTGKCSDLILVGRYEARLNVQKESVEKKCHVTVQTIALHHKQCEKVGKNRIK